MLITEIQVIIIINDGFGLLYCRVSSLTGYEPQDLIEKTLYSFVHTSEMMALRQSHQTRTLVLMFVIRYACHSIYGANRRFEQVVSISLSPDSNRSRVG